MKKTIKKAMISVSVCLLLAAQGVLLISALPASSSQAANVPDTPLTDNYVPRQILVGMEIQVSNPDTSTFPDLDILTIQDLTDVSGITSGTAAVPYTGRQILLIELASEDEADLRAAIGALEDNSLVAYAEPNLIGTACAVSSDTYTLSESLWAMEQIKATDAWGITTGSQNVMVGVLDSGADYNHPALAANIDETLGYNFLCDNPNWWYDTTDPIDDYGHGTHVAGTIGATENDEGVLGINRNVTIVPLKILDGGGNGSEAELIRALVYADAIGIPILNLSGSWNGSVGFQAMRDAVASYSGLLVTAAGNSGNDNDHDLSVAAYPASLTCGNIISVAASDPGDELCAFSSYGATSVDLTAPGSDILSTVDYWNWDIERDWYTEPGYEAWAGTSMAAAHVAGAAALLKAADQSLSAADIKTAILENVDQSAALSGSVLTGGRLNVYQAVMSISGTPIGEPSYELYFNNGWSVWDDSGAGWSNEEEADPGVYVITFGYSAQDFTYTFSAFASGTGANGNPIQVTSIVYVLNGQYENETGVFPSYEVYENWMAENNSITAIATFSDGKVLEVNSCISINHAPPRR